MIDINLIRTHKNFFGQIVAGQYNNYPVLVTRMILDQWKSDPLAVIQTIGFKNVLALNLKIYLHENKITD